MASIGNMAVSSRNHSGVEFGDAAGQPSQESHTLEETHPVHGNPGNPGNPGNTGNSANQPPEGGWGWVVVLGAFLSQVVFAVLVRLFGVTYLGLLDRYNGTATVTSWIGGINMAASGLFSKSNMGKGPFTI